MATRFRVEDVFHLTGRGPVVSGLLTEGQLRPGTTLLDPDTGTVWTVRFIDFHSRQMADGVRHGVHFHGDPTRLAPGTALTEHVADVPEDDPTPDPAGPPVT